MARIVLTDKKLRALRPAKKGKRYDVVDALMPNLLVRVTESGHRSFMFRARFPGRVNPKTGRRDPTRRELGAVRTVAEARAKAAQWHTLIERGIDPKWQEKQDRLATLRKQRDTFLSVAEGYFAHVRRNRLRKAKVIEREIRNEFVSRWAARPIAEITQHDVAAVITAAVARGSPAQAHTLSVAQRLLSSQPRTAEDDNFEPRPRDGLLLAML
jgi:hypothetical protein